MQDVAGGGRTVLFVSHNMNALQNICPKAIYLQNGHVEDIGDSKIIVDKYLLSISKHNNSGFYKNLERKTTSTAKFIDGKLCNHKKEKTENLIAGKSSFFELTIGCEKENVKGNVILVIFNMYNIPVTQLRTKEKIELSNNKKIIFKLEETPFTTGEYYVDAKIIENTEKIDIVPNAFKFSVPVANGFDNLKSVNQKWCTCLTKQQIIYE